MHSAFAKYIHYLDDELILINLILQVISFLLWR